MVMTANQFTELWLRVILGDPSKEEVRELLDELAYNKRRKKEFFRSMAALKSLSRTTVGDRTGN